MFSCQNKSRTQYQFWHFSMSKKAQLPAIITERPILLTKSKINLPGCKFAKYFHYKRAVKSRTRSLSRPRPRI